MFLPEEIQYPDTYYQLAAQKVQLLLSRHDIDINNLRHIEADYQLLYGDSLADSKKLRDAIESLDFEEAERQYNLIDEHGFQVVVPYDKALFDEIRALALKDGFTPALAAKARRITVSCADRGAVKTYCEPIPYLTRGHTKGVEIGWYLLDAPDAYSDKTGLWFDESLRVGLHIQ